MNDRQKLLFHGSSDILIKLYELQPSDRYAHNVNRGLDFGYGYICRSLVHAENSKLIKSKKVGSKRLYVFTKKGEGVVLELIKIKNLLGDD